MVDNQHKKITGYRDLTEGEITAVNAIKEEGERLQYLIEELEENSDFDQRWVATAKTDLQKGIMSAVRAVTRPESF